METDNGLSDKVEDVSNLIGYTECPCCGNKTLPTFKCVPCKICGYDTCGM